MGEQEVALALAALGANQTGLGVFVGTAPAVLGDSGKEQALRRQETLGAQAMATPILESKGVLERDWAPREELSTSPLGV